MNFKPRYCFASPWPPFRKHPPFLWGRSKIYFTPIIYVMHGYVSSTIGLKNMIESFLKGRLWPLLCLWNENRIFADHRSHRTTSPLRSEFYTVQSVHAQLSVSSARSSLFLCIYFDLSSRSSLCCSSYTHNLEQCREHTTIRGFLRKWWPMLQEGKYFSLQWMCCEGLGSVHIGSV